tara:strand:- start:2037 stop:2333 length:297 start_codon:yes stop_codon:yes gene_type:complete
MNRDFLDMLDYAADVCKLQFIIIDGYRTKKQNTRLSGASNNSHLIGRAVVLQCKNANKRYKMIAALLESGFTRIGIGKDQKTIYCDNDDHKPDMIFLY